MGFMKPWVSKYQSKIVSVYSIDPISKFSILKLANSNAKISTNVVKKSMIVRF